MSKLSVIYQFEGNQSPAWTFNDVQTWRQLIPWLNCQCYTNLKAINPLSALTMIYKFKGNQSLENTFNKFDLACNQSHVYHWKRTVDDLLPANVYIPRNAQLVQNILERGQDRPYIPALILMFTPCLENKSPTRLHLFGDWQGGSFYSCPPSISQVPENLRVQDLGQVSEIL